MRFDVRRVARRGDSASCYRFLRGHFFWLWAGMPRPGRNRHARLHTAADGILDRLVHNAHRIEMKGDSMRKKRTA